jgi:hypothetical protein
LFAVVTNYQVDETTKKMDSRSKAANTLLVQASIRMQEQQMELLNNWQGPRHYTTLLIVLLITYVAICFVISN